MHKATVYRRWGTLDGLLVDALTFFADQSVPAPDTGGIDGDLRELARSALAVLTDRAYQALVRAMVSAYHHDQVAQVIRAFWAEHTTMVAEIVTRAVRRGELPSGTQPTDVSRAIGAPLYMRLLVTAEPLDSAAADQSAAAVAAAARAGCFRLILRRPLTCGRAVSVRPLSGRRRPPTPRLGGPRAGLSG